MSNKKISNKVSFNATYSDEDKDKVEGGGGGGGWMVGGVHFSTTFT